MNEASPSRVRRLRIVMAAIACVPFGGCIVYDVASVPVKVAVGTVGVAGNVAIGTAKVAGSVAGGTIKLAAKLAQAGAVTFFDVASNDVKRVPWQRGMTLAGASNAAKVHLGDRPVDVVRDGKVIYSAGNGVAKNADAPIAAGDVVQVSR